MMNLATVARVGDVNDTSSHQQRALGRLWGFSIPVYVGVGNVATLATTAQQLYHDYYDDVLRQAVGSAADEVYFFSEGELVAIRIPAVLHYQLDKKFL